MYQYDDYCCQRFVGSFMSAGRTILDECDSWAPIPAWAFSHPGMTPRALQLYGLLILLADKETGLTFNYQRSTLKDRLNLQSTNAVDQALRVLKMIGCVKVIKNPRAVLDDDGTPMLNKNGKPAIWWGPSQYRVSLSDPGGSHGKVTTPQGVATESLPGWSRNGGEGSHEKVANNQEPSIKSHLSTSSSPAHSETEQNDDDDLMTQVIEHVSELKYQSACLERTIRSPKAWKKSVKKELYEEQLGKLQSLIIDFPSDDAVSLANYFENGRPQVDQRNVGARQPTCREGNSYSPCRLCMGVDPGKGDCQRCGGTGEQLYYSSERGYIEYPDVLGGLPVAERYLVNLGSFYQSTKDDSCYWPSGAPFTDDESQIAQSLGTDSFHLPQPTCSQPAMKEVLDVPIIR